MSTIRDSDNEKRVMLVFNSAYTFEYLNKYGLGIFIQSRDSMHFFDSVLHVNPVASLQYESENQGNYTKPGIQQFDTHNFVLEGRVSQYRFLNKFKLNLFLEKSKFNELETESIFKILNFLSKYKFKNK